MKRILLPILVAGCCLATPLSEAASDYLLEIDGIKGESVDSKRPETIEVSSFSWGVTNSSSHAGGGGGGAGKVSFQDFHFTLKVSKATPKLLLACATGEHIKSAKLFVRKTGGGSDEYLVITMVDCIVTSYSTSGSSSSGDSIPTDQISFAAASMTIEYTAGDGSVHTGSARPTPVEGGVVAPQ